ncbi:MBL fold metallo-hydrolase [Nocardia sp. NPDC051030]
MPATRRRATTTSSSVVRPRRRSADPLDVVIISHLHIDHCYDLP